MAQGRVRRAVSALGAGLLLAGRLRARSEATGEARLLLTSSGRVRVRVGSDDVLRRDGVSLVHVSGGAVGGAPWASRTAPRAAPRWARTERRAPAGTTSRYPSRGRAGRSEGARRAPPRRRSSRPAGRLGAWTSKHTAPGRRCCARVWRARVVVVRGGLAEGEEKARIALAEDVTPSRRSSTTTGKTRLPLTGGGRAERCTMVTTVGTPAYPPSGGIELSRRS